MHGHSPGAYSLQSLKVFPGDPNYTVECLRRVLCQMFKNSPHRPERLHLVLDNCSKENKNKALFGFLALLKKRGIFKEVRLPQSATPNVRAPLLDRSKCLQTGTPNVLAASRILLTRPNVRCRA